MALSRDKKVEVVKGLSEQLTGVKSFIFVKNDGLTVNDSQAMRSACKKEGLRCAAVKKTLLNLALKNIGLNEAADIKAFDGAVLTVSSADDEVTPAKTIKDLSKQYNQLEFFGGFIAKEEGYDYLDASALESLSKLPSKLELQAKLVGTINGPISGFVNVLAGNMRGLVNVLNGIKDQKA